MSMWTRRRTASSTGGRRAGNKVAPDNYGLVAARASTLLYGVDVDNAEIRRSGVLRARTMAHRDAHGLAVTEVNWAEMAG